jgi:hypothetical protein
MDMRRERLPDETVFYSTGPKLGLTLEPNGPEYHVTEAFRTPKRIRVVYRDGRGEQKTICLTLGKAARCLRVVRPY